MTRISKNGSGKTLYITIREYRDVFSAKDNLYHLGEIKARLFRDFYKANCRIEGFWDSKIEGSADEKDV